MSYTGTQLQEIALDFWDRAGELRQTRDIVKAATLVLPVEIVPVPDLSLVKVRQWLAASELYDLFGETDVNDRVMHGFILPLRGSGLIFINAADPVPEQRFTVAHEIAHFLLDHDLPRQRAVSQLGARIRAVLDGDVPAELSDEVTSVIRNFELRQPVNPIEQGGDGGFRSWATFNAESDADRLARELLAPRTEVIRVTLAGRRNMMYAAFVEKCRELLEQRYLLPPPAAQEYAARLAFQITKGPSIMDKLGF